MKSGILNEILSFIQDHKQNGLRLAFTLVVLTIALTSVGSARAKPSAVVGPFTGCANPADQADMPKAECRALVALYNNTNGASWTTNTGWKDTDAPCGWIGVTCGGGHVTQINLPGNNLDGSIPAKLGNLSNLDWLILTNNNNLVGIIPTELGNLSNLTRLHLFNNSLMGSIPAALGNLSNLTNLLLYGNSLTGSIPAQLGNLSSLQYLNLGTNGLSGIVPTELGNLTNLTSLRLKNNADLSGWLPSNLTNLVSLDNFDFTDTSLCEPQGTAFQDWLGTIATVFSSGIDCTTIFVDGFETGDFTAWDANKTGGGDLAACTKAAITGTYGMCVKNKTNNTKFVTDSGLSETWLSTQFNLDPNGLNLENKKIIRIFLAKDGADSAYWLQMRKIDGKFQVRALAKLDGAGKVKTGWKTISNNVHLIEVEWMASSGADDGYIRLYVDGQLKKQKSGLDNDTFMVDTVKLGFTNTPKKISVSGVFFIDDYVSSNTGPYQP